MIQNIMNNIAVCLAAVALPLMAASCSKDDSVPEQSAESATMFLNIEPIGLSRADVNDLPDNEKMNSLRVVVLHGGTDGTAGTIEHNKLIPLEGAQTMKYVMLQVKPGEKKRIYLFANEESVTEVEGVTGFTGTLTDFFNGFNTDDGGFEDAVKDLYFAPDYNTESTKNIAMSSYYEIDFPQKQNYTGTFYVVRVATKFTVNFTNWRAGDVTVNSMYVDSHADRNFLMAHVRDTEQNRQLFNGKSWIDWLKQVSDASSEDDDYATTEAAGWLKDYELPGTAVNTKQYPFGPLTVPTAAIADPLENSKPGTASTSFYLPESMNPKPGATDGEQQYSLVLNIDGVEQPFTCPLQNLKSLFRNTHVIVNITFNRGVTYEIYVRPWHAVEHPQIIL